MLLSSRVKHQRRAGLTTRENDTFKYKGAISPVEVGPPEKGWSFYIGPVLQKELYFFGKPSMFRWSLHLSRQRARPATAAETGRRRKTREPVVWVLLGQNEDLLPSNLITFSTQLLGTATILQRGRGKDVWLSTGRLRREKVVVIHPNTNVLLLGWGKVNFKRCSKCWQLREINE